jgi:signal transduction histidine kinase/ActR/RegA family two-component response regulator
MRRFRDIPIRRKLTVVIVMTSTLTLLLACIAFVAYERVTFRDAALGRLATQAAIVGDNTSSAVVFDDAPAAARTLAALKAEPNVLGAALYRTDGTRFATYVRADAPEVELPARFPASDRGHRFAPNRLTLWRPMTVDAERVGTVVIVADLTEIESRVRSYIGIAALVFLLSVAAAVVMSSQVQRVISAPILHLVDTARVVSEAQNYAIRAQPSGDDEIGLLIASFNEMLAQIQRRDNELERARDEAEAGNRAKDEFLAVVSHELRTPLTPILSWVRLLAGGGLDDTASRRALASIERNARSQAQLIDDLLDVSRIMAGKVRLDIQQLELPAIIDAAIDSTRPAADAKQIQVQTILDPRAGVVAGDPERLQQVLWNLLSNAVKFTPRGGHVQVQLQRVNSHVEISVSDTGQGIAPDFLPYVFERFRQADASSKRAHGGLGLGLAIVRNMVELHGGRVRATSAGTDQGATFTVELPLSVLQSAPTLARVHPRALQPVPFNPSRTLAGVRVLVVDDELDTVETIEAVLAQCGAEVRTAPSAAAALEVLERWVPDLVLSDIGMPDEDGYGLIGRIRALDPARGGHVPAIALTAYARVEDRLRVLSAGFQMHVPKPIEPAELVAVVASVASWTAKA